MSTIAIEASILRELLVRRDELVGAITAGMTTGDWDKVMVPFEGLLVAIKQLEENLEAVNRQAP